MICLYYEGDGANDVDMIQTAHVGVGIKGAEGVQAANASDYSIGRFHFLRKLLLTHGRWNYMRMCKLVLYIFYKNLALVLTQFWFTAQTGWSGQKFIVEYANQSYNLCYTGLPILLLAILDRDVDVASSLEFPQLYVPGQTQAHLNARLFWSWTGLGLLESVVVYLICAHGSTVSNTFEATPFIFSFGTLVFTAVVATVTVRVGMEMHWHHWSFQILTAGSALSWLAAAYIFGWLDANDMQGGMRYIFQAPATWFVIALCVAVVVVPTVAYRAYIQMYRPTLTHIVREVECMSPTTRNPIRSQLKSDLKSLSTSDQQDFTRGRQLSYDTAGHIELSALVPQPATLVSASPFFEFPDTSETMPLRSQSAHDLGSPSQHISSDEYLGFDFSVDDAASAFVARKYTKFGGQRSLSTNQVRRNQ